MQHRVAPFESHFGLRAAFTISRRLPEVGNDRAASAMKVVPPDRARSHSNFYHEIVRDYYVGDS